MIIADKILHLRKKHNLSQEELAEKLGVSRQSVSKWESTASVPDITKIVALSKLFFVTTDYLLNDDLQSSEYPRETEQTNSHSVTIEEADHFIVASKKHARWLALGVPLCILSPTLLIFLNSAAENPASGIAISEALANTVGLVWLFVSVGIAVAIFITSDAAMSPFAHLKQGDFELSFGVVGIIKERQAAYLPIRTKWVTLSVLLFIFGALPLIVSSVSDSSDLFQTAMLMVLFCAVAIGVCILILFEAEKECYEQLLSEGEFKQASIRINEKHERIDAIYWPIVTAIYLGWSFITSNWGFTWIIWPIAALLFSAITAIFVKE